MVLGGPKRSSDSGGITSRDSYEAAAMISICMQVSLLKRNQKNHHDSLSSERGSAAWIRESTAIGIRIPIQP